MVNSGKHEAAIPNPKLKPLVGLVGNWKTEGSHPYMPGVVLHGRTSFEWMEGGAFLIMRTEIDEPGIPSGLAVFGTDDETDECFMLYFDERGVSRRYETAFEGNVWKWWRNSPTFSQRMTMTLAGDGRSITLQGELSKNGSAWEKDLQLNYARVE